MKTLITVKYSREEILKLRNFDIFSMMEETGIREISLEILPHGKCRVLGCETIHHLNWSDLYTN